MKTIPLTKGYSAIVDDDDFDVLIKYKWFLTSNGYAGRSVSIDAKRSTIRMHRYVIGAESGQIVDHINGNRLDNRKDNLRICNFSQNIANSKKYSTNVSGFKGVYRKKGRWQAQIVFNWKVIHLGSFDDPAIAHEAYKAKAKEYFGEYARFD